MGYGGAMTASLVAGQLSKVLDIVPIAMGYGILGALGAAIVWARAAAPCASVVAAGRTGQRLCNGTRCAPPPLLYPFRPYGRGGSA